MNINNKKIALTCLFVLLTFFVVTTGWKNKKEIITETPFLILEDTELNDLSAEPLKVVEAVSADISFQKVKSTPVKTMTAKNTFNTKQTIKKRTTPKDNNQHIDKSKFVKLVAFSELKVGKNCATGGYKIEEGYDVNMNEQLEANEIMTTKFVCKELKFTKVAEINPNKVDFFEVSVIKNNEELK